MLLQASIFNVFKHKKPEDDKVISLSHEKNGDAMTRITFYINT